MVAIELTFLGSNDHFESSSTRDDKAPTLGSRIHIQE